MDEKLRDKHSDIVYRTKIKGLPAFLYILFEHQSSPDPLMVFRLLCYMVNLWKEYRDQHPKSRKLPQPQTALEFLELVLRYVYHARNDDEDTVRKYIVQGIEYFDNEKAKEAAMTLAERIERRGEKRGKKIGEKRGEKRGEKIGISSVYDRLLRKRFGGMTPVLEKRLTDADLDMLNRFGDSIPDFRNLKEAEKWWDEQGTEH